MAAVNEELIWPARAYVYQQFASTARPPAIEETAAHFGITAAQASLLFRELHQRHALFLDPGTTSIRMANPFSAVPTPFRVNVGGLAYWANCAWDALGIPAALHSDDATIEATDADSGEAVTIILSGGKPSAHGEVVHFLVPFRHWYDDLIFT